MRAGENGSCGGGLGLRRAGSVERCLRRLGSAGRRFSFCFGVRRAVLRMILRVPFWNMELGQYVDFGRDL